MGTDNRLIWVTGAHGMLGREVIEVLEREGISFFATDRECDITDLLAVDLFLDGKDITHIINCAAYTAVDQAEDDTDAAYALNAIGPNVLAEAAQVHDAQMIHVSTDYVFDGSSETGYQTDDEPSPISIYGATKAAGEQYVMQHCSSYAIVRTAWLYGKGGNNFVTTMLKLMNDRDTVSVVTDQHGSPTWAADLAGYLVSLTEDGAPKGIHHYTNTGDISWYDFALEIYRQGRELGLITSPCDIKKTDSTAFVRKAERPAYSYLRRGDHQTGSFPAWQESLNRYLIELKDMMERI